MTFLDDSTVRVRSPSSWSGLRRRYHQQQYFQKRYLCFWILAAFFPFMLLRLVFFYDITVPSHSPARKAVTVKSGEFLLRRRTSGISETPPASRLGVEPLITNERSLIQVHKEASTTQGEQTNVISPLVEISAGTFSGPSSRKVSRATESSRKRHPSVAQDADDFGLPEDNEMEDLASWLMAEKEHERKKTRKGTPAKIATKNRDYRGAKQGMRADEQGTRAFEERQANLKKAAKEREDEEMWNSELHTRTGELRDTHLKQGNEVRVVAEEIGAEEKRDEDDKLKQAEEKVKKHKNGGAIEQVTFFNDVSLTEAATAGGECDLFDGDWEYDPEGPLYTNTTCFYMQGNQNCLKNGRPDKEYLHWRWKPRDCDLPRFDARAFLEAFVGKTIGFVGDSLARNQMQSLLCMLSQIEIPIQSYRSPDDNTVRWLYDDHQVTLAVVWSPYLLKESNEGIMGYGKGQSVLYLDELDTFWTSVMTEFDILVLSVGQWYFKPSVYIKQDEIIGCHYCPDLNLTEIRFDHVYRDAVRQVLEKVVTEFKGIAIMSTFAISHFEDGPWENGGQCRRERPLEKEEGARFPGYHNAMHDIVMSEYDSIISDRSAMNEDVKLEFLDVTKLSLLRADGHPGPYRQPHPFEGRNPDEWVPNDCLHWCLPGPVDTWNQLLVKLVQKHL